MMSHTINSGGARNRNVDCFKIFLMVLIVTHHGIVHGLGLKNIVDVTTSGRFELIVFFTIMFFRINRCLLEIVFYSFVCYSAKFDLYGN